MNRTDHINEDVLEKAALHCRQRGIVIPTFAQLAEPSTIPPQIAERLGGLGMSDVDPLNLFRITWKNEPLERGGGFNHGNWIEFPPELTRVDARIIGIVGKWFPTGTHKVGAAFGCLVPRLVTGQFDPSTQKAVWPSTGNYCRGGAFDSALLGCDSVAILPEEMSPERFAWLDSIGAEIIRTPGCESNVKEIYDKCWEIRRTRPDCVIFNQFEEFGNAVWHYHVTGGIVDEIFTRIARYEPRAPATGQVAHDLAVGEETHRSRSGLVGRTSNTEPPASAGAAARSRLAAFVSATGSAGTIAAGDYLRTKHTHLKVVAVEALQCPTLLHCGFGGHRIEGIGDKHVPWIHNLRNTDMVCAVDDQQCLALLRLFNEEAGRRFLESEGVAAGITASLPLLGISSICNLVAAAKTARYYDMSDRDIIFTPLTDSADLYQSRIAQQSEQDGAYTESNAARHFARYLEAIGTDHMRELGHHGRKALHNLKYFTWVEQQQRSAEELRRLWTPDFWTETFEQVGEWDRLIADFNRRTGLHV